MRASRIVNRQHEKKSMKNLIKSLRQNMGRVYVLGYKMGQQSVAAPEVKPVVEGGDLTCDRRRAT